MELLLFLDCMWLPLSEKLKETSLTFSRREIPWDYQFLLQFRLFKILEFCFYFWFLSQKSIWDICLENL